jgi:hypothetical protein
LKGVQVRNYGYDRRSFFYICIKPGTLPQSWKKPYDLGIPSVSNLNLG